jgi:hypothetical protein
MATTLDFYRKWVRGGFPPGTKDVRHGNALVSNGVLYDYGMHYVLGVHAGSVVLVNNDKYSRTTSKHQGQLMGVCSRGNVPSVRVDGLTEVGGQVVMGSRHNLYDIRNRSMAIEALRGITGFELTGMAGVLTLPFTTRMSTVLIWGLEREACAEKIARKNL